MLSVYISPYTLNNALYILSDRNPNHVAVEQISIDKIVNKARREHKRKVSQFEAIKGDITQYFPNEEEATRLAAEVMKEHNLQNNNPNVRVKNENVTVDDIVQKALDGHKRKVSQFRAIKNDLGLMFNEEDVNVIAKDAMKAVFAQKQIQQKRAEREAKGIRRDSVKPPNLFGSGDLSDSEDEDVSDLSGQEQVKYSFVALSECFLICLYTLCPIEDEGAA